MADSEIRLLIKTVFDQSGSEQAIAAEKRLQDLADQGFTKQIARERELEQWRRSLPTPQIHDASTAKGLSEASHATTSSGGDIPVPSRVDPDALERIRKEEERLKHPEKIWERSADIQQLAEEAAMRRRKQEEEEKRRKEEEEQDEEPSGGKRGNKSGIRAIGSAIGRAFGLPGLGQAAAIGGGVGAGLALYEGFRTVLGHIVQRVREWEEGTLNTIKASQGFATIADRVETIGQRLQRARQYNEDFALSFAQIERRVKTVAADVQHWVEMQQTQITYEQRLDEMQTQREMERARLRNMFNPIGMIQEQERLQEAAFQRQMQRESELERRKLAALQLTLDEATKREARYRKEQERLTPQISAAETVLNQRDLSRQETKREAGLVQSRAQPLMTLLDAMRKGTYSGEWRTQFLDALSDAKLDPDMNRILNSADARRLYAPEFQLGITTNTKNNRAGVERIYESIHGIYTKSIGREQTAEMNVNAAQFDLDQKRRRRQFTEEEIQKSETERQNAEQQQRFEQEQFEQNERYRKQIRSSESEMRRTRTQREVIESGGALIIPRGPDTSAVNEDLLKAVQEQTTILTHIRDQWS